MSTEDENALVPVTESQALVEFKTPPPPPKRKKKKILEEDDYEEGIVKIIERDFFPDLPKLRAQSEYLEAKSRNDVEKLRELHIKYGPKRVRPNTGGGSSTDGDIYTTPASFETPTASDSLSTPKPDGSAASKVSKTSSSSSKGEDIPTDTNLRLDKFLYKNTSEDNESFVELMEESERKRKEKQAWLYVKEGEQQLLENQQLALPSMEEQAAIEGNPHTTLNTWTYKPANALMYNVEGAELTAAEKVELASKVKVINTNATRFTENPFKEPATPTGPNQPQLFKGVPGRVDVDGTLIGPSTPQVGGYNFVATPTPNPDAAGESPMMTWGEIEGTPFLLDASDQPIKPATPGGPTFKLKDEPKRDRIGRELAEKVAKQYRDKKGQAVERVRSKLNTPSAGLSRSERLATLSPAARKLAAAKGIHINTDKALKASYTPSPLRRPLTGDYKTPEYLRTRSASTTPSSRTPKSARTKARAEATPTHSTQEDLTDNLLNLPNKRKSKAADYF